MKFDIKSLFTSSILFTAEIECSDDAGYNIKLGLAIRKAVEAKANLTRANLYGANLYGANLTRANLDGANLYGANLWLSAGNNRHLKTIQAGDYLVAYSDTMMQIGCQRHAISEWWDFDDHRIAEMDGKTALKFWRVWKPLLQAIIAASPAESTGYVAPEAVKAAE